MKIQKIFWEQIVTGEKKFEYRKNACEGMQDFFCNKSNQKLGSASLTLVGVYKIGDLLFGTKKVPKEILVELHSAKYLYEFLKMYIKEGELCYVHKITLP